MLGNLGKLSSLDPVQTSWKDGEVVEEVTDVTHIQKENPDMVGFLLGCSFSFEVFQWM